MLNKFNKTRKGEKDTTTEGLKESEALKVIRELQDHVDNMIRYWETSDAEISTGHLYACIHIDKVLDRMKKDYGDTV